MAQVHYAGLKLDGAQADFGRWSVLGHVDWREWDGDFVVRVDSTAKTFLLSPLAGEVLKAMLQGAAYVDEIAARIFAECVPASAVTAALVATFAAGVSDEQALLKILNELEALGLARADLS